MKNLKMKKIYYSLKMAFVSSLLIIPIDSISQEESIRSGSAGASELLINPWSRSSGWGTSNISSVEGLEGQFSNVAGLASIEQTELIFSQTSWLQYGNELFNADESVSSISTFGFAQKVGESGVMGIGVMSMNFGDIEITTVDMPDGGIGTFSPSFLNIGASYAHVFSNSIRGGFTLRMISEQISDVSANGVAFDAGIQYSTGDQDELKFGISFKNWGPRMSFTGDGLSFRGIVGSDDDYKMTVEQRSSYFDLPALFNIGASYDVLTFDNRLTFASTFTSNSFQKDQYRMGTEFSYKEYLMLRLGYVYEEGQSNRFIGNSEDMTTAFTGPTAGFTIELPMSGGTTFGLDYSYIDTNPFKGCHAIGCRINL
tara:strand:+ start:81934 stop:83043 length:1110 start_codon:yes stop_codon:yes gene_type:complete